MSSDERWCEALSDQRVVGHGEGQEYVLHELGTNELRDLDWIAQAVAILKPLAPDQREKALSVLRTFVRVYGAETERELHTTLADWRSDANEDQS